MSRAHRPRQRCHQHRRRGRGPLLAEPAPDRSRSGSNVQERGHGARSEPGRPKASSCSAARNGLGVRLDRLGEQPRAPSRSTKVSGSPIASGCRSTETAASSTACPKPRTRRKTRSQPEKQPDTTRSTRNRQPITLSVHSVTPCLSLQCPMRSSSRRGFRNQQSHACSRLRPIRYQVEIRPFPLISISPRGSRTNSFLNSS